jgi:Leucine-rich repeat (LRR) protein
LSREKKPSNGVKDWRNLNFGEVKSLENLNAEFIKIVSFSDESFAEFQKLTILNLACFQITEINANIFRNMNNLTEINLGLNHIEKIKTETFLHLDKLKKLVLSRNRIKIIDLDGSHCLSSLEILNLNCMFFNPHIDNLTKIEVKCLSNFKNLKKIHFIENFFDLRDLNLSFVRLDCLEELDMKSCYRSFQSCDFVLGPKIFTELKKLRILNLSCCLIKKIELTAFEGLNFLENLNLSGNDLTIVDTCAFINLKWLKILDLRYNQINVINFNEFNETLERLEEVYLSGDHVNKINKNLFRFQVKQN